MTIITSDFKIRFPNFNLVPDIIIDMAIEESDCYINECFWGCKAKPAQMYLTAHLLLTNFQEALVPIAALEEELAEVNRGILVQEEILEWKGVFENSSYGPKSMQEANYAQTKYGRQFYGMLEGLFTPANELRGC